MWRKMRAGAHDKSHTRATEGANSFSLRRVRIFDRRAEGDHVHLRFPGPDESALEARVDRLDQGVPSAAVAVDCFAPLEQRRVEAGFPGRIAVFVGGGGSGQIRNCVNARRDFRQPGSSRHCAGSTESRSWYPTARQLPGCWKFPPGLRYRPTFGSRHGAARGAERWFCACRWRSGHRRRSFRLRPHSVECRARGSPAPYSFEMVLRHSATTCCTPSICCGAQLIRPAASRAMAL